MTIDNHGQCLACKFLRRSCPKGCRYIPLFRSYFNVPRFQIGAAASPSDRQNIEALIMARTKIFEANAGLSEPVFGATGILLALHQHMSDEVGHFETITDGLVHVNPPGTMNHFFLTGKREQQHEACPACTYLLRKCENCPFVQFFEADRSEDFIREFYKLLLGTTAVLPDHPNLQLAYECNISDIQAKALEFEKKARVHDPVYGITGIILSLYKDWLNLIHHASSPEQRHRSVQNLPTVQNRSCDVPTNKGRGVMIPESTNVAHDEWSTIDIIAERMDLEDDESLDSREVLGKKCMELQHEVASIQPQPQELNYSFHLQQGESSNIFPLSSVPHRMNQPSADQFRNTTLLQGQQQLHRVSQQTQQQREDLLLQPLRRYPERPPVQGILRRIPENVPQNVSSQLQQQFADPSHSQQAASSSLRAATSSKQGMSSSTGEAINRAWKHRTPQERELLRQTWRRLPDTSHVQNLLQRVPDRPHVQDILKQIPEHVPHSVPPQLQQQFAAPSHSQQAASSSLRAATSSQQGMSSSTGEAINRALKHLTPQVRGELLRQTWRRLPDTSHVQNLLQQFPDRPRVQDILNQISEHVPHSVPPQLQQQLAAPSHTQQAASSSLRVATSSQQGMSSSTGTPPTNTTTDAI